MRVIGLILCCLLVAAASPAAEVDFLHGEVLEVDFASLSMLVQTGEDQTGERIIDVVLPADLLVETSSGGLRLPGCVSVGNHVRVWGRADNSGAGFAATEVRGCGMAACNDPTGVRSRLYRNRKVRTTEGICR